MSPISKVFLYSIFVIGNIYADKFDGTEPYIYKSEIPIAPRYGMVGVASAAGILSRNGRVSSVGGIQFFPSLNNKIPFAVKDEKALKQNMESNENMANMAPNNINWRKDSDGNIAEGSINFYPGGVAVSSSAKSRNIESNANPWANPFNPIMWPMNDPFSGPSRNFNYPGSLEWIHKDMFNNYVPPNLYSKRTWLYPTFNPFLN
ncbi:uncharacterized protein LOC125077591 [Vanessa atalanta]|uniref:uncharacterized protein LOC125077591 n=1 Tax=Vanessa atalanta TaxID=42275 RepID=UPI001FCD44F3|nr:uncharacterized protein LOC125077591 [Vanessa atalanta]